MALNLRWPTGANSQYTTKRAAKTCLMQTQAQKTNAKENRGKQRRNELQAGANAQ